MPGKNGYDSVKSFIAPINSEIMAILESGNWSQWTKEWSSDGSFLSAQNILSGTVYKGGNVLMCGYWMRRRGYTNNLWATEKQLRDNGYYVKKNSEQFRGFVSLFAPKMAAFEDKDTGEKKSKMIGIRPFTVINFDPNLIGETPNATMSVYERIAEWERANRPQLPSTLNARIDNAEKLIQNYLGNESIQTVPGEPSYSPSLDIIMMPKLEEFTSSQSFYVTYLHECAHSSGHSKRLDRLESTTFGSEKYAFEELIAELTAVYLSAYLGLEYNLERHASYLGSWLKGLKSDLGYFVKAANAAQKAMEYILTSSGMSVTVEETDKELIAA